MEISVEGVVWRRKFWGMGAGVPALECNVSGGMGWAGMGVDDHGRKPGKILVC